MTPPTARPLTEIPIRTVTWSSKPAKICTLTANTIHLSNVGLMLSQRRRRWTSIEPSLGYRFGFVGVLCVCTKQSWYSNCMVTLASQSNVKKTEPISSQSGAILAGEGCHMGTLESKIIDTFILVRLLTVTSYMERVWSPRKTWPSITNLCKKSDKKTGNHWLRRDKYVLIRHARLTDWLMWNLPWVNSDVPSRGSTQTTIWK